MNKVVAFIDGSNVFASCKALGLDMDYSKLPQMLSKYGTLVRMFYYTAMLDDGEVNPLRPLVDWLDYHGYHVVSKPTKEFIDRDGNRKIKGNMDIELAVDVMDMADRIDHIFIFSGDGDFRRLIESVQRKGVRVTVVSTIRSTPPMCADLLRRQADEFLELQDLQIFKPTSRMAGAR